MGIPIFSQTPISDTLIRANLNAVPQRPYIILGLGPNPRFTVLLRHPTTGWPSSTFSVPNHISRVVTV